MGATRQARSTQKPCVLAKNFLEFGARADIYSVGTLRLEGFSHFEVRGFYDLYPSWPTSVDYFDTVASLSRPVELRIRP